MNECFIKDQFVYSNPTRKNKWMLTIVIQVRIFKASIYAVDSLFILQVIKETQFTLTWDIALFFQALKHHISLYLRN